jgi:two-component system phosphate regulon sensor histidine kinase PhoR
VKHVLQRHGAELRIVSKLGEGSTFSCHFPNKHVLIRSQESENSADNRLEASPSR